MGGGGGGEEEEEEEEEGVGCGGEKRVAGVLELHVSFFCSLFFDGVLEQENQEKRGRMVGTKRDERLFCGSPGTETKK